LLDFGVSFKCYNMKVQPQIKLTTDIPDPAGDEHLLLLGVKITVEA